MEEPYDITKQDKSEFDQLQKKTYQIEKKIKTQVDVQPSEDTDVKEEPVAEQKPKQRTKKENKNKTTS